MRKFSSVDIDILWLNFCQSWEKGVREIHNEFGVFEAAMEVCIYV